MIIKNSNIITASLITNLNNLSPIFIKKKTEKGLQKFPKNKPASTVNRYPHREKVTNNMLCYTRMSKDRAHS